MFLQMDVGGVQEPKPVPAARYSLLVTEAKFNQGKEGKGDNIECSIAIQEHPTAPNIRHFIALPKKDDDAAKANFKKLMLKRFLEQFKVPHNPEGFNVEDFAGCTANAEVTLTEPDAETNAIYNRLKLDKLEG